MTLPTTEEAAQNREIFTSWCKENHHNILASFPKSGRNYLMALLRATCNDLFITGASRRGSIHPFEDIKLFACHRGTWDMSEKGRYVLLFRDPRDSILSRTFVRSSENIGSSSTADTTVPELLNSIDWIVRENICEWRAYFETFLQYSPHLVQYEKLCLNPVRTIKGILDYLDSVMLDEAPDLIPKWDAYKPDPHKYSEHEPTDFATGYDRYKKHCLKWQRSEYITKEYRDIIWKFLGPIMQQYGYTEEGHSEELLQW